MSSNKCQINETYLQKVEECKKQLILRKQQRETRQLELRKKALDMKLEKTSKAHDYTKSNPFVKANLKIKPDWLSNPHSNVKNGIRKITSTEVASIAPTHLESSCNPTITKNIPVRKTITSKLRYNQSNFVFLPELPKRSQTTPLPDDSPASSDILTSFNKAVIEHPLQIRDRNRIAPLLNSDIPSAKSAVNSVNSVSTGAIRKQNTLPKTADKLKSSLPAVNEKQPAATTFKGTIKKQFRFPQPTSQFKFKIPIEKNPEISLVSNGGTKKLKCIDPKTSNPKSLETTQVTIPPNKIVRRSITSIHRSKLKNVDKNTCIRRSASLSEMEQGTKNNNKHSFSKPDKWYQKSSKEISMSNTSLLTATPIRDELQCRLQKWLKSRGRTLQSFPHLRCFVEDITSKQANKENVPTSIKQPVDMIDAKPTIIVNDPKFFQSTPNADVLKLDEVTELRIAESILHDLHKLILEGYSKDQCEKWLYIIKYNYGGLKDMHIYWECKAALQGENGNFYSAVTNYEEAIIKGAEPTNVQKHLDSLLEKFSDLSIDSKFDSEHMNNSNGSAQTILHSPNNRSGIQRRNMFTSTVIKFAVQKRETKLTDMSPLQFIVTPVRRSMRICDTTQNTPTTLLSSKKKRSLMPICFNSLNNLSSDIKKSLVFKTNPALD